METRVTTGLPSTQTNEYLFQLVSSTLALSSPCRTPPTLVTWIFRLQSLYNWNIKSYAIKQVRNILQLEKIKYEISTEATAGAETISPDFFVILRFLRFNIGNLSATRVFGISNLIININTVDKHATFTTVCHGYRSRRTSLDVGLGSTCS